jgi:hypothetical protein
MNYKLAILFFCFSFVALDGISGNLKSKQVVKVAQKVADWQLANPNSRPMGDWVMAMSKLPGGEKYEAVAMEIGKRENWGVIETKWIGNDHCTPQAWIELYEIYKDTLMIAETLRALDKNIVDVAEMDDDLRFINKNRKKWSWCVALFMSPPAFARLWKVTGEQKYYDFMNEGILDKATYMPATIKAWKALKTFVTKEGMFTGIQPIGDAPVKYKKNNSMPYGVGAFLLASSEVYNMLEK